MHLSYGVHVPKTQQFFVNSFVLLKIVMCARIFRKHNIFLLQLASNDPNNTHNPLLYSNSFFSTLTALSKLCNHHPQHKNPLYHPQAITYIR